MRSNRSVCVAARGATGTKRASRTPTHRFAIQHVRAQRPSPWSHCKSWRGFDPCGAESRFNGLPLFCGQRSRRPLFQQDPRRAQSQRGPLPPATKRRRSRRPGAQESRSSRRLVSPAKPHAADGGESRSKKALILEVARELAKPRYTPAEIEQIRRKLIANLGAHGKTSVEYIVSVLEEAGMRVVMSTKSDTEGQYEEEFSDLLHFSTLDEAEMCLVRLDELLRKFLAEGESAAAERVREVASLGRRRAEMIARNHKVDATKRAEKEEIAQWFGIWLNTPDAFFDWLEVRKQSPDFQSRFPQTPEEEA